MDDLKLQAIEELETGIASLDEASELTLSPKLQAEFARDRQTLANELARRRGAGEEDKTG